MPNALQQHKLPSIERHEPRPASTDAECAYAERLRQSERWHNYSRWLRSLHPLCAYPECDNRGAVLVHHIISVSERPDLLTAIWNTLPSCNRCHPKAEKLDPAARRKLATHWKMIMVSRGIGGVNL